MSEGQKHEYSEDLWGGVANDSQWWGANKRDFGEGPESDIYRNCKLEGLEWRGDGTAAWRWGFRCRGFDVDVDGVLVLMVFFTFWAGFCRLEILFLTRYYTPIFFVSWCSTRLFFLFSFFFFLFFLFLLGFGYPSRTYRVFVQHAG